MPDNGPNALAALIGSGSPYQRPGKLTAQQKSEIGQLLQDKLGSRACDMCAQTAWAIGDNIVQPTPLLMMHATFSYSQDFMTLNPSVYLVCTNCGNTKLFLLAQLGYNPFIYTPPSIK